MPTLREITLRGPLDVRVEDEAGGWYGLDASGFVTGTLSDVTIEFLPDATIVTMPQGADYRIVARSNEAAVAATFTTTTVSLFVSDFAALSAQEPLKRQAQALFADVPLPPAGDLLLPDSGASLDQLELSIDADANGSPEESLPPDALLTDPVAAQDALAPVTTLSADGPTDAQGRFTAPATLTLAATDGGSGVLRTHYSLDGGATWSVYTTPVAIPVGPSLVAQAWSVDRAGNVEYPVKTVAVDFAAGERIFLPTVAR